MKILEKCLKMVARKYDRGHMTLSMIRLHYGKVLHSARRFEEAIAQLEALENDIDEELTASQGRSQISTEDDDEKVGLKMTLYSTLKESYQSLEVNGENLESSRLGVDRVSQKVQSLRQTFKFSSEKG